MTKRNQNIAKLQSGYLFPEINRRKNKFLQKNPDAKLISLGIGDTTEPITRHIAKALTNAASALGTRSGYRGYGDEQGLLELRRKIAEVVEIRRAEAADDYFATLDFSALEKFQ